MGDGNTAEHEGANRCHKFTGFEKVAVGERKKGLENYNWR
jgi:hypothetical protein